MSGRSEKMIFILFWLLQMIILVQSITTNYDKILENEHIKERLRLLEPELLLAKYKDVVSTADMNRTCARDFVLYRQAINRRELWALKMLDASSKIPPGLLQGNIVDMGMFDECMAVTSGSSSTGVEIRGRHCMYSIEASHAYSVLCLKPTLSICVPASCDEDDVIGLVNGTVYENNEAKALGITVLSATCADVDTRIKGTGFFISVAFFIVCIGFVAACTLCDLVNRQFGVDAFPTLVRFSMLRNAEAILSTEMRESEIPVVNGIRVISTAWVMIFHAYFIALFGVIVNPLDVTKFLASWSSLLPLLGVYAVDTFFTISAFLMTYNFFKKMRKNKGFNILLYYLHRLMRLTVPILAIVAFTFVILSYPGSGANYKRFEDLGLTGCQSKWWSSILFVQNFVEKDNYCLIHLWSMSVDMQLFWISPLILYPLHKRPKVGLAIVGSLFLASVITTAVQVGFNKYYTICLSHELNIEHFAQCFEDVYIMPYSRVAPWLIGILLGYIVSCETEKPNKPTIYAGWFLACFAFVFCIFGTKFSTTINCEYNVIWEVIFAAIVKPTWAFGICWIIYVSIYNFSGSRLISKFLSWKFFLPLSKISYSFYLVHLVFPILKEATSRTSTFYNTYSILHTYVGDVIMATVLAFFFSLIFEVPMLILDDIIFRRKSESIYEINKIK